MKSEKSMTFIVLSGIVVLCVFTVTLIFNIMPNHLESGSYYVKVEDEMSAKIEALYFEKNRLFITTSGDALDYCIKSTKSTPDDHNLCWKRIENNTASMTVYPYKKYYVWIKDANGKISSPMSIHSVELGG